MRARPAACAAGGGTDGGRAASSSALAACAAGEWLSIAEAKALKLAPDEIEAKIVFSPLGRAMTRVDALVLNRIAQLISGDGGVDYGRLQDLVDEQVRAGVEGICSVGTADSP